MYVRVWYLTWTLLCNWSNLFFWIFGLALKLRASGIKLKSEPACFAQLTHYWQNLNSQGQICLTCVFFWDFLKCFWGGKSSSMLILRSTLSKPGTPVRDKAENKTAQSSAAFVPGLVPPVPQLYLIFIFSSWISEDSSPQCTPELIWDMFSFFPYSSCLRGTSQAIFVSRVFLTPCFHITKNL